VRLLVIIVTDISRLPLANDQPEAFINLPEYILDDIVRNFNFVFR
jgi:hypothetical protein